MSDLFHYTCAHRYPQIRHAGHLIPAPQPMLNGRKLVWLTDLEWPARAALGLTQINLKCDRTEYRVRVENPVDVTQWVDVRRQLPFWGVYQLEHADGVLPRHWWVSEVPQEIAEVVHLRGVSTGSPLRSAPPTT